MTLQMTEPPYKFGVRRPKNKEYEEIDDLAADWDLKVQKYPDIFERDCIHGLTCKKINDCNCTDLSQCVKLEDQTKVEDKNNSRSRRRSTNREKDIVTKLRKQREEFEQIHTYNIVVLEYLCIECDNKYCDHEAYRVTWTGSNPYEAKRQYVESTWDRVFMGDKNKFVTPLEWKCPDHPDAAVLKCHYICQYDEELPDTCIEEDFKLSFRWSDEF